jgi:hypothetical protein
MQKGTSVSLEEREMRTKYQSKRRLVTQGFGFWSKIRGEWCVRIAGPFHTGDTVPVMSNSGIVRTVILGAAIRDTEFTWPNEAGEQARGRVFSVRK